MRKVIEINEKKFKPAELTFNNVVKLEDMGVSLMDTDKHSMALVRGYVALCENISEEEAGNELEQHVIKDGTIESIAECLSEAVNESGFFQALNKKEEEKTPTTQE